MPKPNLSLASLNLNDLNEALYAIESLDPEEWGLVIPDSIVEYASRAANLVFASPATAEGAPTFRALVTADFPANGITDAKLRDSAALSVIGRSANSTGDPADIAAGTDGHVLRRSGTTLGFGTVADSALSSNVALENTTQTWTQKQTFSVAPEFTLGHTAYGRSVNDGEWAAYAYNAANFTADAGNWTVDDADEVCAYTMIGKTMIFNFGILTTDVSATPTYLAITIPEGKTSAQLAYGNVWVNDAGAGWAQGYVDVSGTTIRIWKNPGGTTYTTTAADNTSVLGQVALAFS